MSEQPAPVVNNPCDACGQVDDHPMVHIYAPWQKDERTTISDPSFHFDCLPQEFRDLLGDAPEHARTRAAIQAAEAGTRGDALRAFIAEQPNDNEEA